MDGKNQTYEIQDLIEYFRSYRNKFITIKGETKEFNLVLYKGTFSHLMGLQYMQKNTNVRGVANKSVDDIVKNNLSDQEIIKKIYRLHPNKIENFVDKIENIKYIFENLENSKIVERTRYTDDMKVKSNYLIVKTKDNKYLNLGIVDSGFEENSFFETFLISNNEKYYEDSEIEENIESIWIEGEEIKPFSFNKERCEKLQAIYILDKENFNYQKSIDFIEKDYKIEKIINNKLKQIDMDLEEKYKKEEKQFRGWNNREKFKEELER